ncbi:MAG: glycosyltransferase family 4 protein [Chloroflexi bacterium]|nr:glycosyltransferase family 4 protein [Chloroflexota bacterium]
MEIALSGAFWGQRATGSGQYVHTLLEALLKVAPEHRYRVYVPSYVALKAEPPGVEVIPLGAPHSERTRDLAKLWFEQWALPRACRRDGIVLLHVPYFAPILDTRALRPIVTIHDVIPLILPAYRGSWRIRAYLRLVCHAARRARLIITDSHASARDIQTLLHIPSDRLRVIHLAADARYRPPDAGTIAALKARLGLPSEYLLYLGGFDRRKNIPELLQAYAAARASAGELMPLVIAGKLPAQDTFFTPDPRRIARELGVENYVRFTGWVEEEDKPALYGGAWAFLFPSRYEGFGLPVLEAISCGTPAIVASGSSLEEVAGPAALVVPPNDVPVLAEAIRRIALEGDLRAHLAAATQAQAARFSTHEMALKTLQTYQEALT